MNAFPRHSSLPATDAVEPPWVRRRARLPLVAGLLACAGLPLAASESFIVGARALGMGGANVASVNSELAQYYNPATFGFFGRSPAANGKSGGDDRGDDAGGPAAPANQFDYNDLDGRHFGFDDETSVGLRINGNMGRYLNDLNKIDINRLSNNGITNEKDLQDAIRLSNALANIAKQGNAVTADANTGVSFRFGSVGIGVRAFGQAAGVVDSVDTANLGLPSSLNTSMNSINPNGNDGQTLLLSPAQQGQLAASGLSGPNIQKIDFLARQQGISGGELQNFVNLTSQVSTQSNGGGGGGALANNQTSVRLRGFGLLEIPVTYGRALNDHISIGVTGKLMIGRVYGDEVIVFNSDSNTMVDDLKQGFEQTITGGIDVGVLVRYGHFNFAITGRNLNAPSFAGPTVNGVKFEKITLDPQVTAGVAFFPIRTLTLEVDADLLSGETVLPGYDTRNLSFGVEWNAFHFLALRAGAYKNLAESDIGVVYTLGLGINLWALRIDLAGAASKEHTEIDGRRVPNESRASFQISADF